MRVALVNPAWRYEGSVYFGCREPHLPLELGYARALLVADGHQARLFDGQLQGVDNRTLADEVAAFGPDMTVVTTAPTYLFWRCTPPELRVPGEFLLMLDGRGGTTVVVGPHGSATPAPVLHKLEADFVVRGECEEVVAAMANAANPHDVPGIAWFEAASMVLNGPPAVSRFVDHAPLEWPDQWIAAHRHHHHRFDQPQAGFGAEVEASRGCPYACSFCAKLDFRDRYRRRSLEAVTGEIDRLVRQGVGYVYFIDEIFLPQRELLEAMAERKLSFGVQTRIDLWKPELLELLGRAGCVSIEAGVESITPEGRDSLAKRCKLDTDELSELLLLAKRHVPFVQANLIGVAEDDPQAVANWRTRMIEGGLWVNQPVPMFPYPSSPGYRDRWGDPDTQAWERAHAHYLETFHAFSDIQEDDPLPLAALEEKLGRSL